MDLVVEHHFLSKGLFAGVLAVRRRVAHFGTGTHIRSSLIAPASRQSTMQNFDASHAKFRARVGAFDSTELTFNSRGLRYNSAQPRQWTLISSLRFWKSRGKVVFRAPGRKYSAHSRRSAPRSANSSRNMETACSIARARRSS